METGAIASSLIKNIGKKWYYITADYAFGHTLQSGFENAAGKLGGQKLGADLTPLGTTDFSSYLIKAQAASPDVVIFNLAGDDMVNALKQAVQFGLDKKLHIAGAQQELEPLEGLPPEARIGTWVFEWYWNQPGVAGVKEFVDGIKKKTGRADGAHLVRLRLGVGVRARRERGQVARRAEDRQGAAGFQAPAPRRVHARCSVLPRRAEPAHPEPLRRPRAGEGPGGTGRPLPRRRGGEGSRCGRYAGGKRLQDDLAHRLTA
jgi:hypothetical protein